MVIGTAVFLVLVVSVYNAYMGIFAVIYTSRAKIEAISLINEQLEIARNMPYADVGIVGGIPNGKLTHIQTLVRGGALYSVTTTVRNVDDPFDGRLGQVPNDLSPADFKLVEIEVTCGNCKNFTPMVVTTRVAPKNLETASTNGALFVRVFDASGNPVPDANVHIVNAQPDPDIVIDDITDANGSLQIVDAPPGVNAYEITVTKTGYSTDKTYTATVGNPNPTKPHATVVLQQVTQVSFIIDRLSTMNISSVTNVCDPVSDVDFTLSGSKLIGTPAVLKYTQNHTTNGSGLLTLNNIEWDTYSFAANDASYDLIGINPLSPFSISPNATQNIQLIVGAKNPKTVLVTVRDSATSLPLSGVSVELTKVGYDVTQTTGQGFLGQTDWSGGGGQATSTDPTKYLTADINIETGNPVGDVNLKQVLGEYVSGGVLTSSSFNTGSASNFQKVGWNPTSQPLASGEPNVRVQIATNNDGGMWNYRGPDGTAGTYYTSADQNIFSGENGMQYLRYKLFLDTASTSTTPNISDISFTFTSLCTPPGQVSFSGLATGVYAVTLTKTNYVTQNFNINVSLPWQALDVNMVPN